MTGAAPREAAQELPARPADLTLAFLQRVISTSSVAEAAQQRVASFSWKALEVGVISEVVGLEIELYAEEPSASTVVTKKHLIAKFLRPEFPFERMFEVESNFYEGFGSGGLKHQFPFALPRAIFLSKQLIIMERVEGIETFSCVQGCPEDQIIPVVTALALMHGRFWNADCSNLATSAGIGSELSAEAKQEKFPESWQSYLDDVPLEDSARGKIAVICEKLSQKPDKLALIHKAIADGPSTLIHGDFHTGNMLFPVSEGSSLALVDWATCGKGNPLRDLAFLFIVGVRSAHRAAHEATSLQVYYDTLVKEGVTELSLEELKRQYRLCVLNQFLILVVYDSLSKHLASNAKTEKLRQELHAHFREVNVRASLATLLHFDEAEWEML